MELAIGKIANTLDALAKINPKPERADGKLTTNTYSGLPHENLEIYLWQNETMFQANATPNKLKVVKSMGSLRRKALSHIHSLGMTCKEMDWETYKEHLKKTFTPRMEKEKMLGKLTRIRQERDLVTYTTEFMNIVNKLQIGEEMKILFFVKGLKPKTQAELNVKKPKTLDEAIELATIYEGAAFGYQAIEQRKFEPRRFESRKFESRRNSSWKPKQQTVGTANSNATGYSNNNQVRSFSSRRFPSRPFTPRTFGQSGSSQQSASNYKGNNNFEKPKKFQRRFQRPQSNNERRKFNPKFQEDKNIKCFNCNKTGHKARDCRAPKQRQNYQLENDGDTSNGNNRRPLN